MKKLAVNKKYPYIYEPHLHTSEGSKCATSSGKEMADACFKAGYTGIFVTDHFFYGNTAVDRSLPWQDWVTEFCEGYESAKKEGDKLGLQVFFGWEATYDGTDFLIYGLSKEWLYEHPEIKDISIPEQYELVHKDGGMVIHAHPYRTDFYIPEIRLFPDYVDGVETVNASHSCILSNHHNNPDFDKKALIYAKENNLPQTAGSDLHSTSILYGGMAFSQKLQSSVDYIRAVRNREACLLLDGNETIGGENNDEGMHYISGGF